LRSLFEPADRRCAAPDRMVWLPGAYQSPEDFIDAGFHTEVRRRALPLDLVFVDLEPAHLADRSPLETLRRDVLDAARRAGCARLWLAGISMGGYAALDVASAEAGACDALVLLAPYLGNRVLAQSAEERRIWQYIEAGPRSLYLGFGDDDRFAAAHRRMAQSLPPSDVDVVAGGHDWPTWTTLWSRFLDSRFT
jgi:pimeloyl-ACP methyl ester carboxylesterase